MKKEKVQDFLLEKDITIFGLKIAEKSKLVFKKDEVIIILNEEVINTLKFPIKANPFVLEIDDFRDKLISLLRVNFPRGRYVDYPKMINSENSIK